MCTSNFLYQSLNTNNVFASFMEECFNPKCMYIYKILFCKLFIYFSLYRLLIIICGKTLLTNYCHTCLNLSQPLICSTSSLASLDQLLNEHKEINLDYSPSKMELYFHKHSFQHILCSSYSNNLLS